MNEQPHTDAVPAEAPQPGSADEAASALPTEMKKADLGKRFLAVLIDAGIAVVVSFVPVIGGLAAAAYWLIRDGLALDFMDHRSVGKKLMDLRTCMSGRVAGGCCGLCQT